MNRDESAKHTVLLEEYRRKFDSIDRTCKEIKNRMLLFLTADLAILAYFFSDITGILPDEPYGIIFFSIGVGLVLLSIGILMMHYRAVYNWPSPMGPVEIEKIKTAEYEKEIMQIMIDDYELSYNQALKITGKYAKAANLALLLFAIGVIILLIIKFF